MNRILGDAKTQIIKNPNRSAALILSMLALIFISPAFFQGRYMAPVDTTRYVAPYLDITTQILPWYKLSGKILGSGHFPFWNTFSGQGLPLMANMQSAVFFPLTWLFYIFNFRLALVAYSFLKLWLMGMFTYLYLRELKLSFYAGIAGAILFAFCNANVIWFLWPLTSVILILPLSFLLIERYFNTRSTKIALWLAPVTTLGLFAGHPQTFFYIFCAIYAYVIFKSFTVTANWKQGIKTLILISLILFLGVIISAIAVLPFLEYLKLSANLDYRSGFTENPFFLPPLLFLANLIPDFYGNTGVKNFSYLLVPNYGELALGYIGLSGFILSLLAFGKKVAKQTWFFLGGALMSAALVYHAPLIYQLINKLPGFNLNYNNRLLYIWAFCLSILGAFGLERLLKNDVSPKRHNRAFLILGAFAGVVIIVNRLATQSWTFAHGLDWHTVSLWQWVMIAAFIMNLTAAYFIIKGLPTKGAVIALFILIAAETTIHGMVFTKTSLPQNFYPSEPALTYLANQYSNGYPRVFTYGDNLLPNIGTWYHINQLNDHDTIYLKSNKKLKSAVANYNYSPEYTFGEPNLNALRFLSVKYLLYPPKEGRLMLEKHPQDLTLAFADSNYSVLSLNQSLPRAYTIKADTLDDVDRQLYNLMQNPSPAAFTGQILEIGEDGSQKISYNSKTDNYLITTDNYYPGWLAAFQGGSKVPAQNSLGLRVFPIKQGQGTVEVSYYPKSFYLGLKISLAALVLWLLMFIFSKRKKIGSII